MIVTIPIAQDQGNVYTKTINIRDYCPTCGAKRGIAKQSKKHQISAWSNPCGHRDTYEGALLEYSRRMHFEHHGRGDKYEPTFESFFNLNPTIKHL